MNNQQREWLKSSNGKHRFLINDTVIGELLFKKMEAFATLKTRHYTIRKKGFWKTQVEILDEIGHVVLETRSKNWYGPTIVTLGNQEFTLELRTKGGPAWAIVDNGRAILTYKIVTEDDVKMVKMTALHAKIDPIWDFFLWFTLLKSPYSKTSGGDGDGSMSIMSGDFSSDGGDSGDGGDGGGDCGGD